MSMRVYEAARTYAEGQTAPCGYCGTLSVVRERFAQATRLEPMRSLGFQAYCPKCQVSFKVNA